MSRKKDWSEIFVIMAFVVIALSSVGTFAILGLGAFKVKDLKIVCEKTPGKRDDCRIFSGELEK